MCASEQLARLLSAPPLALSAGLYVYKNKHSGGRARRISEFKARLVYKVNSRTAGAKQRKPVPKNKTKQNTKKKQTKKRKKKCKI